MTTAQKRPGEYLWDAEDGSTYVLTDLPTDPCHECGAEIGEDEYCYFREGPASDFGLDHVCWDCGDEVTGFAD